MVRQPEPELSLPGQIWASMWNKHSGQKLDGVIAVDPSAL
jgi:hypothetical protein